MCLEKRVTVLQAIKTKDVLVYATMPRVVPRIKELFSSGFSFIAFWMAHVYYMVRLLPRHHPYLSPENKGRFGIFNVISEASRHLVFKRQNIDQLLVYFGLLGGVIILLAQIVIVIYSLLISPAMASTLFNTINATDDIAYNLLDRVFGIPHIYCDFTGVGVGANPPATQCTSYANDPDGNGTAGPALPLPFHAALHDLFQFYSTALMSIAVLIFAYFVMVILLETATSGTPFGQRFQNVWVPVRLVVAVGLLLPVGYGINSGQYIVLYTAKYGSNLATFGWNEFNDGIRSHTMFSSATEAIATGEAHNYIAIPEPPAIAPLIEAMTIVHACAYAYVREYAEAKNITKPTPPNNYPPATAIHTDAQGQGLGNEHTFRVVPFLVKQPTGSMTNNDFYIDPNDTTNRLTGNNAPRLWIPDHTSVTYKDALGFYYGKDIVIRFGEYAVDENNNPVHRDAIGGVAPLCGDIRIHVADLHDPGGAETSPPRGGPDRMLKEYYDMVLDMWFNDLEMRQFARSFVTLSQETDEDVKLAFCSTTTPENLSGTGSAYPGFYANAPLCAASKPNASWKQEKISQYTLLLRTYILDAWSDYVNNSTHAYMDPVLRGYGWGGAGIWYSKIAEINGGWMDGVTLIPYMDLYPMVMEEIKEQNLQNNETVDFKQQYVPSGKMQSAQDKQEQYKLKQQLKIGTALSDVFQYWHQDAADMDNLKRTSYQTAFMDAFNMLLGTSGLLAIRGANAHLHPLAQLTAVGKGLVDSAVRNLAAATGAAFLGGVASAFQKYATAGALANMASEIFVSTAFLGLTAGFILFYVLPFMPFIYFFFAISSWLKSIFEAMVGVPLWALAHLRIDGEGLPGDAAQNGYFLLLDIFIRPILTVVGLVAAIVIFSAQVRVLNLLWDLVSANLSGNSVNAVDPISHSVISGQADILGMGAPPAPHELIAVSTDARFQRNIIDQFFFTVIYTIVCYMLALSSFKLIDKIPDNILRWSGAGVSAFGDINQDNIESVNRYVATGGLTFGQQATGAVVKVGGGLGGMVGKTVAGPPPGQGKA